MKLSTGNNQEGCKFHYKLQEKPAKKRKRKVPKQHFNTLQKHHPSTLFPNTPYPKHNQYREERKIHSCCIHDRKLSLTSPNHTTEARKRNHTSKARKKKDTPQVIK
jgi:hypothetical protein